MIPGLNIRQHGPLDAAMEDWRRVILICHPEANADHVRALCDDIVARAEILSRASILRFTDVAIFLLERSKDWAIRDRLPLDQIGGKMPKNLNELGMLKLAEGSASRSGAPLTNAEIARVRKAKPNIIH